jgi:hypothetical protein
MKTAVRSKLVMARSARDFCRANPAADPSYAAILAQFEDRLGRAEQLAKAQIGGLVAEHSSTVQRQQLRRAVHDQLRHLSLVAAVAAKKEPELVKHFRLPEVRAGSHAYRTAARAALDEALARRDLLIEHGMATTLLDDLSAALTRYDAAVDEAQAGRRMHVGAVAELSAVAAELIDLVRLFDGLNRYRFRDNAELLAAWASAKNVAGPSRGSPEAGTTNGTADGANVKPAA